MTYDDDDEKPFRLRVFLRRNGAGIGIAVGLVVLLAVGVLFVASGSGSAPAKKIPETLQVKLEAPPPPPPPPPQQVEQPKMIEQPKMAEPEFKPATPRQKDEPPPKAANPDDKPPSDAPLGLDAEAEGPGDSFNLAGNPGGGGLLGGGGGGGGGGSRWGWYATIVQNRIESALRNNDKTKQASARTEIRLWLDASGRIERAQLVKSTGDAEVDRAIEDQVLPGLAFNEAPPKEMPMPVVVRLTARRPS